MLKNFIVVVAFVENFSDTEAPFFELDLSITNGKVQPKFMINGTNLIL